MNKIKALLKTHPAIFGLLGLAFVLDITGVMNSVMPGTIFGVPSLLAVIYCVGLAVLVRFVIARRRVHLAIAWPVMVVMYFSWFIIVAVLTDGQPYTPSLLFVLCLVAAFKTMRFQTAKDINLDDSDG